MSRPVPPVHPAPRPVSCCTIPALTNALQTSLSKPLPHRLSIPPSTPRSPHPPSTFPFTHASSSRSPNPLTVLPLYHPHTLLFPQMNAADNAAASLTPSTDSSASATERQLLEDLASIINERREILAAVTTPCSPDLALLQQDLRKRLQSAADLRDYKLANLRANFDVDCQQAWNDFQRAKKDLRTDILTVAVDRRRKIDSLRASGTTSAFSCTAFAFRLVSCH